MFGSQSSTPFGQPSGGFGSANTAPAFGTPAPAATPFGAPAPSAFGGFGTPAPAPSGFGGFGAPAPAPTGGFGGFGTPAPAPAFGSSFGAPAPSGGLFGAPAPAPTGLFGAPAPAPTGLFGSTPAPAPAFGSSAPAASPFGGGGFGTPAPAPSAFGGFGAPAPATGGLFGSTPAPAPSGFGMSTFGSSAAPAPSAFGAPAPAPTGGLFGAPAPATGGLFGAPAAPAGGSGGTKVAPFEVTNRQDGQSSISLQSITAMPQYETKSFEELRFEDYSQGNKGGTGAPAAGSFGSTFGSPAPAPGLFGAPAPAPGLFGAPAPAPFGGGFGAPAPAPFGSPAPAPFGAPAPAPFGSPAPAPFGAPAPSSFGGFGAKPPASGGLFGAPAPAPSGGLFGAPAPAPTGLFGAPAPGGFGAPAPAPSLFGAPAPAPFGAPAPAPGGFGAPAPPPAFGFGSPAPAPSGGLFGAPAPGAFGAPPPAGGLFGAPAPAPTTSLFGAPAPAPPGGLFGAPAPAPPAAFGSFGAPAPAPGLFGAPAPPAVMPPAPAVGSIMPPVMDELLVSQMSAVETKRKELEKRDNFSKHQSETSLVAAATLSERDGLGSTLAPIRPSYSSYRASPQSSAMLRPRGFASPEKMPTPSLSRLGSGGKPMAAPDTMAASAATRLIISPPPGKPKLKLALQAAKESASPLKISERNGGTTPSRGFGASSPPPSTPASGTPRGAATPTNGSKGYDYYQQVSGSGTDDKTQLVKMAPTLTKPGYVCTPPIDVLADMRPDELAAVENFSVERAGFGKIEWEGAVDIRGTNLDDVVVIESKSASVYTKEEEAGTKPSQGTKLNRPAVITLEGVFPPDSTPEAREKLTARVRKTTKKMAATLVDFDADAGVWKLRVDHFSRYGLDDDDSDDEQEATEAKDFLTGEREGRSRAKEEGRVWKKPAGTPYKLPQVKLRSVTLEEDDDESMEESRELEDAEVAYETLQNTIRNQQSTRPRKTVETAPFPEEGPKATAPASSGRYIPTAEDFEEASETIGAGICDSIAKEVGLKASSIDMGRRMGRSFRVGWSPDGSFISLQGNGVLVRQLPKFAQDEAKEQGTKYLQQHQANAEKLSDYQSNGSFFSLGSGSNLQTTLTSYVQQGSTNMADPTASVAEECFSLLKSLSVASSNSTDLVIAGAAKDEGAAIQTKKLFAIQRWLVDSCADEVSREIYEAKIKNEKYAALLAAVTGGDTVKACDLADELGLYELATILAAGPQGCEDVLKEVMAWSDNGAAMKMPDGLIRSYFLLGGDMSMEEDIYKRNYSPFDWRRRLTMRLSFEPVSSRFTLASLLSEYEKKVSSGSAPFPQPRYMAAGDRSEIECVLYRLLRMGKGDRHVSLTELVDPVGYTGYIHDYSLAFNLAAILSAMGTSLPMSDIEEQQLIDGYTAQLVAQGNWEWAVYVSLCVLTQDSVKSFPSWKLEQAKNIVLQHYKESDSQRRMFLENVGVPGVWFAEALALRCKMAGDAEGYLRHVFDFNPKEAESVLEGSIISNMLFHSKSELETARALVEEYSSDGSLAGSVAMFFNIYENVQVLRDSPRDTIEAEVPGLVDLCDEIEKVFVSYQSSESQHQGPRQRSFGGRLTVPMSFFLAEILSQTALLKMQLRSLQVGRTWSSTVSQMLRLSAPETVPQREMTNREDTIRWLM